MIAGRVDVGEQVRAAGRAVTDIDFVAGRRIERGEDYRPVTQAYDVVGRSVVRPWIDILDQVRGRAVADPQFLPVAAVAAAPEQVAARDDRVLIVADVAAQAGSVRPVEAVQAGAVRA